MKDQLAELITLISSGCMTDEEIARIADEAAQAYADPDWKDKYVPRVRGLLVAQKAYLMKSPDFAPVPS